MTTPSSSRVPVPPIVAPVAGTGVLAGLVPVEQVATAFGVTRRTTLAQLRRAGVPITWAGRRTPLVRETDLAAFIAARTEAAHPPKTARGRAARRAVELTGPPLPPAEAAARVACLVVLHRPPRTRRS